MLIKPLSPKQIPEITSIHLSAMKGDFLTLLGKHFLSCFYSGIIGKEQIYGFFCEENKQVKGFIIGTKNIDLFFKTAVYSNFLKLSFYLSIQVFKRPSLLNNIFETFLYPKKDQGIKPELVILAVSKENQGKGIGKKLIHALENKFKEEKVRKYKLTVHADKKAVSFYDKLGFLKAGRFTLYNKPWYIYEKAV